MIPTVLLPLLDAIEEDPRTDLAGGWTRGADGRWSLPFVARLSVPATAHVAAATTWHLVVGSNQPSDGVYLYPDASDGLTATFQHQDYNGLPVVGARWRPGKPCLERPVSSLGRAEWSDEPTDLGARMIWKVERLLRWIDCAASGTLVEPGDPLELPSYANLRSFPMIGFSEDEAALAQWEAEETCWGFARIAPVPGAMGTSVVTEFGEPDGRSIRKVRWSQPLSAAPSSKHVIWIRVPVLPVIEPWRLPATWRELRDRLKVDGVDLTEIVEQAGILYRASRVRSAKHHLILGFPMSERVGGSPGRLHWIAIGNVHLAGRKEKRKGFRPVERNQRMWDRQMTETSTELAWHKTANWAPDQIRKRGEAEDVVRAKRVLIIGAGTLGAAVAENLLRMGVTAMGVVDDDRLEVGNLSRHVLTMASSGHLKSEALAAHLNGCMPDADVRAFTCNFPPLRGDTADAMRSFDVIVDCTASDDVLDAMATFEWHGEKLFVSLAMTWRAEGLLAYSASEAMFPAIDAKERFSAAPAPDVDLSNAPTMGIGCWHAVFPATADDVSLWAAVASKFVRRAMLDPRRRCKHFRQSPNGSVVRTDA